MNQEIIVQLDWIKTLNHKQLVRVARFQIRQFGKIVMELERDKVESPEKIEEGKKNLAYLKKFTHEKPSMYPQGKDVYFEKIKNFVIFMAKIWHGDKTALDD